MARKMIDLSMEVYKGMVVSGNPPSSRRYSATKVCPYRDRQVRYRSLQYRHHRNGRPCRHAYRFMVACKPQNSGYGAIPIEYCYGDGVVLDLTYKGVGDEITVPDQSGHCRRFITPLNLDIVLIHRPQQEPLFKVIPDRLSRNDQGRHVVAR